MRLTDWEWLDWRRLRKKIWDFKDSSIVRPKDIEGKLLRRIELIEKGNSDTKMKKTISFKNWKDSGKRLVVSKTSSKIYTMNLIPMTRLKSKKDWEEKRSTLTRSRDSRKLSKLLMIKVNGTKLKTSRLTLKPKRELNPSLSKVTRMTRD